MPASLKRKFNKKNSLIYSLVFLISISLLALFIRNIANEEQGSSNKESIRNAQRTQDNLSSKKDVLKKIDSRDPTIEMSDEELKRLAEQYALLDPEKGVALAELLSDDPDKKAIFLRALFDSWAERDALAVVQFITSQWSGDDLRYSQYLSDPLKKWSKEAPLEAASLFRKLIDDFPGRFEVSYLLEDVLSTWTSLDPQSSISWLQEQGPLEEKRNYLEAIIGTWAKINPTAALDQSALFEDGSLYWEVIHNKAIAEWSESSARSAAEWFDKNVDSLNSEVLSDAINSIGKGLVEQESGEVALEWVDKLANEETRNSAVSSLGFYWAVMKGSTDSFDALQSKIEEGRPVYGQALLQAAEELAIHEPGEVAEWLLNQENKEGAYDRVARGLVSAIETEFPLVAYQWSTEIQDEAMRTEASLEVLTRWSNINPQEFDSWYMENSHTLSENIIQEINLHLAEGDAENVNQ